MAYRTVDAMTTTDDLIAAVRSRRSLPDPAVRRLLRERAGLSQAEVAKAIGVRSATVSRWEAGLRTPRGAHVAAYVVLLDRLAEEVFGRGG